MTTSHWTEHNPEDFLYSIASDFVEQLRVKMKKLGMSQSKLAKAAKVSKSYVSQVFNDPGNLSLITIVKFAKAVGMKVSVVGYEDANTKRSSGPINPEVFRLCWERQGKPTDMWSLKQNAASTTNAIDIKTFVDNLALGFEVFVADAQTMKPSPHVPAVDFKLPIYVNQKSGVTSVGRDLDTRSITSGE